MDSTNPLLGTWDRPYGLPPFDLIKTEHFAPALDAAMAEHRAEVAAIAANPEAPSFANTIEALDRSGATISRVAGVFFNLTSSLSSEAMQAVEAAYAPKMSEHQSAILLDGKLFARVEAVYQARERLGLDPLALRLVERTRLNFVLAGALLDEPKKARLAEIGKALAAKTTAFAQFVLQDEDGTFVFLESEAELAGLPADLVSAAAELAKAQGKEGKWAISTSRSFVEPFLTHSTRRELREKVWRAFNARGELSPARDTKPLIKEILALRSEQAKINGYGSFAEYALVDRMAKKPEAVSGLFDKVWPAALKRAAEEKKLLESYAKEHDGLASIEAWDWLHYAEKIRKRDYDLDEAEVKPYFSERAMVEAMFWAAGRLFGIDFVEVKGVPLYHEDARLFEVRRKDDGALVGVFINDNFARPGKRSGAWMSNYREQSGGFVPIVTNNNNFTRGKPGEPVLLSFDDASTLFHEFGHGLHGLLSDVRYGSLSGTNVLRDFVELPSQLFEHWALAPELLKKFARHVETGAAIPDALVEKIRKTRTFNSGWETVQYVGPALLDMLLHARKDAEGFDAAAFEAAECARLGVPKEVGLRHRLPHFQHLFASEGYAAGYYVYMWAEVLDADAYSAFEEKGDPFDPALAARLKDCIYAAGNSREPSLAFRLFRGRDPEIGPLLKQRGLA